MRQAPRLTSIAAYRLSRFIGGEIGDSEFLARSAAPTKAAYSCRVAFAIHNISPAHDANLT